MRKWYVGVGLLLAGLGCFPSRTPQSARTGATGGAGESPWVDVRDVRVEQLGAGRRLTLQLTRTPEYFTDWVISDPPRLIIDVGGPLAQYPMPPEKFGVEDAVVRQVRVGSHGPNLRAVLDLSAEGTRRRVHTDGPNLIVDIGDVESAEATGTIPPVVAEAKRPTETTKLPEPPPTAMAAADRAPTAPAAADLPRLTNATVIEPLPAAGGSGPADDEQLRALPHEDARQARADAPAATPPPAAEEADRLLVRDVHVETSGDGRRVRIELSREPKTTRNFALTGPPRLVIDLDGPLADARAATSHFALNDDVVQRVRVAPFQGHLRVVLDLHATAGTYTVRQEGSALVADVGPVSLNAIEPRFQPTLEPVLLAANDLVLSDADDGFDLLTPPPLRGSEPVPRAAAPVVLAEVAELRALPSKPSTKTPPKSALNDPDVFDDVTSEPHGGLDPDAELDAGPSAGTTAISAEPAPTPGRGTPPPMPPAAPTRSRVANRPVLLAATSDGEPVSTPPARRPAAEADPPPSPTPPPRHKGVPTADPTPTYHGQRISLDFKDADIQNVLRVLADTSGLNLIATDDVKGHVTLHLNDVPWDQALDLVLRSNRLDKTQEGNVVRISTVNRFKEERESLRAAEEAERELEPLHVQYVKVNYARADESLVDKVKGVLTDRGSVTFDDRTNTVIVRDITRGIGDAGELIRQLDIQSPQVLIEAHIVEATDDLNRGLGVQWGYSYNGGPQTGTPTGTNFPGTVGVTGGAAPGLQQGAANLADPAVARPAIPFLADFPVPSSFGQANAAALDLVLGSLDGAHSLAARLTALEEEGRGKVISRPRVITMNNVPATIQSLTILRVKLPSTGTVINTGTGGVAGGSSTATEKINTGITLVVTPQVSSDGFVLMSIYAKSSQPDFNSQVDGIPNEISREANSNVLVKDNDTVVLGGIYRQNEDDRQAGLPYLRNVPGLGWLFRRDLRTHHHEELLVFLTPKIISTGDPKALPVADRLWQERKRGG